MTMLDIVAAILLGAGAAAVVGALLGGVGGALRVRLLGGLAAWFGLLLAAGAAGLFANGRTIAVGVAAVALLGVGVALGRSAGLRGELGAIPIERLIGVHVLRLLGAFFVLLHASGRVSAPFGPVAGWGDVAVAGAAPFVAWAAQRQWSAWRALTLAWNTLGLADLLVAVGLGITSVPGAPMQLFFEAPGTTLMGNLPWVLVPTFLVPLFILTHVAVFQRLRRAAIVRPAVGKALHSPAV